MAAVYSVAYAALHCNSYADIPLHPKHARISPPGPHRPTKTTSPPTSNSQTATTTAVLDHLPASHHRSPARGARIRAHRAPGSGRGALTRRPLASPGSPLTLRPPGEARRTPTPSRSTADAEAEPITRVADGRTPWQLFHDVHYFGNSRIAPCTVTLKIRPCRRWLDAHADPASTSLYIGLDATSRDHSRAPAIATGWRPWTTRFPMLDPPHVSKQEQLDWPDNSGCAHRGSITSAYHTTTAAEHASAPANSIGRGCSTSSPSTTPPPKKPKISYATNSATSQSSPNNANDNATGSP